MKGNQLNGGEAAAVESVPVEASSASKEAPSRGANSAAFKISSLPAPPADWAMKAQNLPSVKLHGKYEKVFPNVVTLTGSDNNGRKPD
ncbi:hypothetical protein EDB80DRAFT_869482 [Ilyonectria destructans]|nr:hypothetical protein EDB80DRAFT_869482 [Ilyonectria destructans]